MNWITLAKELPVNQSRRVNCWHADCQGKKTASITNMGSHYAVFCFKCKSKDSADLPPMTPAERWALKEASQEFQGAPPALPEDFTLVIPVPGLLWLSRGGLHMEDIRHYGFGWSDKLQRVIMPVYEGDDLIAVQARSVSAAIPKYLGQVKAGPRPVFKAGTHHGNKTIVLTEDILSAARVGKVTQAWALLGTNLMHSVINQLAEADPCMIVVWMDSDQPGIDASLKIRQALRAVGLPVKPVCTPQDPKHVGLEDIRRLTI